MKNPLIQQFKESVERFEEVRHQINTEIAGIAGILNGSAVQDTGQAMAAQQKLGMILSVLDNVKPTRIKSLLTLINTMIEETKNKIRELKEYPLWNDFFKGEYEAFSNTLSLLTEFKEFLEKELIKNK